MADKSNEADPRSPETFDTRADDGSVWGKRADVFPTEPVQVMPVSEIVDSAGPPLGTPVQSAPTSDPTPPSPPADS
jgi:hypothetical protein